MVSVLLKLSRHDWHKIDLSVYMHGSLLPNLYWNFIRVDKSQFNPNKEYISDR